MISYRVILTDDARTDVQDIARFIQKQDGPERAQAFVTAIFEVVSTLEQKPDRGMIVPTLSEVTTPSYRQIWFKPYRIIYRVQGDTVFIMLVVDGRRDLWPLVQSRLQLPS